MERPGLHWLSKLGLASKFCQYLVRQAMVTIPTCQYTVPQSMLMFSHMLADINWCAYRRALCPRNKCYYLIEALLTCSKLLLDAEDSRTAHLSASMQTTTEDLDPPHWQLLESLLLCQCLRMFVHLQPRSLSSLPAGANSAALATATVLSQKKRPPWPYAGAGHAARQALHAGDQRQIYG
jgi:hypothetical protein